MKKCNRPAGGPLPDVREAHLRTVFRRYFALSSSAAGLQSAGEGPKHPIARIGSGKALLRSPSASGLLR
jgi:hypothetical protein